MLFFSDAVHQGLALPLTPREQRPPAAIPPALLDGDRRLDRVQTGAVVGMLM